MCSTTATKTVPTGLALLCAAACGIATAARAQTSQAYSVLTSQTSGWVEGYTTSPYVPVSNSRIDSTPLYSEAEAGDEAGVGLLRSGALAVADNQTVSGPQVVAQVGSNPSTGDYNHAMFGVDDILITAPAGVTSVSTRITYQLDGTVSADAHTGAPISGSTGGTPFSLASGEAQLTMLASDGSTFLANGDSEILFSKTNSSAYSQTLGGDGVLPAFNPAVGTYQTAYFTVPVGHAFSIEWILSTTAYARSTGNAYASSNAAFNDTFSWGTSGAVFDLPSGYNVNSAEGGITNNSYTLTESGAAPEPCTAALAAATVGMWLVARRRRMLQ